MGRRGSPADAAEPPFGRRQPECQSPRFAFEARGVIKDIEKQVRVQLVLPNLQIGRQELLADMGTVNEVMVQGMDKAPKLDMLVENVCVASRSGHDSGPTGEVLST